MIETAAVLVASYFIGAFPTSYVVGRAVRGIDLREHGSRNLGATNLYRVLGWRFAVPVALVDIAKGAVPVALLAPLAHPSSWFALVCGVVAILGHVYSVFVGFRGGKGVATTAGVFLGLTPLALGGAVIVWAALVFGTGYVSVGSIAAAASLPVLVWALHPGSRELVLPAAGVAAAIVWLHRANIRRLMAGTESRFGRRAPAGPR